ncbi:MAG: tRNA-dihydrouridine synthase [Candidatus Dojkabacteria bacterium]|nr:tRNA-dihydrouridine synthase [Candidatus Dojkabacteria bacterium]
MNIYKKILEEKGKISALAPMEDVTDTVFRQVLCDIGKPDLFFTEFMSTDGFMSKGRDKVIHRLEFTDIERPVTFQLWGNNPDNYAQTVKDIVKYNPDGIDINIGCSVRSVLSHGHCSALIKEPELVEEIIKAVRSESQDVPVSVKTRLGYDEIITDEWFSFLLKRNLDLITVHGRISKDGYSTPANWEEIEKVVRLRNEISPNTVILGNGDVNSLNQADEYISKYDVDGVMVGRGILQNPWLFSRRENIGKDERIDVLKKHLKLFDKVSEDRKPFYSQRKYMKMYISNFDGASELRSELMKCNTVEEVLSIV